MRYDSLMIHYGELSTKGNNRKQFIRALLHNVRGALKSFGVECKGDHDHIYVHLGEKDFSPILARLQDVPGIQKISLVARSEKDIETLKKEACELISLEKGKTFKVTVKRTDKTYPLDSYGIAVSLGDAILEAHPELEVDVHNPDINLKVRLGKEGASLSCHDYPGVGGYPMGMNGKVTLLLSGGIDSPVAAYALMRRGIKVECLHFAAPPYTPEAVLDKLKDILKALNEYQSDIKLEVVPFTELQLAIYSNVPEPYCITIMRRMMLRIAEGVAKKNRCLAIATGESIGQVASQTLSSMQTINAVTSFPIMRPLCCSDKLQIIATSQRIKTYEISIRPYEDCCTIFKPKKPKTKPRIDECEKFEAKWDWQSQVQKCIDGVKAIYLSEGEEVFSHVEEPSEEEKSE